MASLIFGPNLFKVPVQGNMVNYVPNSLEAMPNSVINVVHFLGNFIKWTVIFWLPYYGRKLKTSQDVIFWAKFTGGVLGIYSVSFLLRGLGRIMNTEYNEFIQLLIKAKKNPTSEHIEALSKYDFDFSHFPAQYHVRNFKSSFQPLNVSIPSRSSMSGGPPMNWLTWMLAHSIGVRLAYPGCAGILNSLMAPHLREKRTSLLRDHQIKRIKIVKHDNHEIESFYVDRRSSDNPNGKVMVVCCEGNAGFPELGTTDAPIQLGYSVIGWNHPGFAGSTGLPFPEDEQRSIDAVMQFVLSQLNFKPEEVIVYAWSIGGYAATWTAMNYPNIRSLVLDATFDNLDELSKKALPQIFYPLVLETSKRHMDLNNLDQIKKYNGPVRFIRRTRDEIISTAVVPDLESNRGNFLIVGFLKNRYPHLFDSVSEQDLIHFLSTQEAQSTMDDAKCAELLRTEIKANDVSKLGTNLSTTQKTDLLIYIVRQYLTDFDSTHCSPLSPALFTEGWLHTQV